MITKITAGYTSVSPNERQCANCVMFKWGSCDLVDGMIEPYAVCNNWEMDSGYANAVGQVVNVNEPVGLQAG